MRDRDLLVLLLLLLKQQPFSSTAWQVVLPPPLMKTLDQYETPLYCIVCQFKRGGQVRRVQSEQLSATVHSSRLKSKLYIHNVLPVRRGHLPEAYQICFAISLPISRKEARQCNDTVVCDETRVIEDLKGMDRIFRSTLQLV